MKARTHISPVSCRAKSFVSCRAKSRHLILALLLLALAGCTKSQAGEESRGDAVWRIALTKTGSHTNHVATYRANLLNYGTGRLMSDGAYSGYYKADGWLYPCRVDDATGKAIDKTDGTSLLEFNAADWFNKTDTNSVYGLRAPSLISGWPYVPYSSSSLNYTMVLASPAVRMQSYLPDGETDIEANYHWGVPLDRKKAIYVSDPTPETPITATYYNNEYTYSFSPILIDQRSKLTIKIACGALSEIDINAVYFSNVMSTALYMPQINYMPLVYETFEHFVFDGDDGSAGYDPLVSYYTANTYPASAGQPAGAGDKFVVPAADTDVHLVRRIGQTPAFIANDEWDQFVATDEWVKGNNTKYFFTPIKDFPVFAMDYSEMLGSEYKYKQQMPKVIIRSGDKGNIRTTVRLPYNFEPMREYTLWLWMSSVYVQAVLTVAPWDIYRHWTEDASEDTDVLDVTFGGYKTVTGSITVWPWENNAAIPDAHGTIND